MKTLITKKKIYLSLFILFGVLLSFIVHGVFEVYYIELLINDFDAYSFGYTWGGLIVIHHILALVLFTLGVFFGFSQGEYWWGVLYEPSFTTRMKRFFKRFKK